MTGLPAAAALLLGYLGGPGTDDCDGIALDRAGDLYLACHSNSSAASMDAWIVKIEARTGRLVWSTRTGGADWDAAGAIQVAHDGSVYVAGQTQSADFPTTPDAVQRSFAGPRRDVFVLKLDPAGRIVYSTLLGGSRNDEATGFAVAEDGTVYVGGATWSPDFPGVRRARFGPGGTPDGFIARLRPGDPHSLETVLLGGKGRNPVNSLALDRSGNLYAAGFTTATDFAVQNSLQSKLNGEGDAFLLKLRLSDWSLLFSTFLGGSQLDSASAVAVDSAGNPIVSGITGSPDFPVTSQAFQKQRRGTFDAFVTKLSPDGARVLWSTYYGGSKPTPPLYDGGDLALDETGRVWITGMTAAADLPLRHPLQPAFGGGDMDGFLAAFSPDGSRLCYATYLGGSGHDILEGLALGGGKVYASGITASPDLPRKGWQVQPGFGGGPYDAIVLGIAAPAGCR